MGRKPGSKNKSIKGKIFHERKYWTIRNLAREYNLNYDDLYKCLEVDKMRPKDAVTECLKIKKEMLHQKLNIAKYEMDGTEYNLKQWSVAADVNYKSLRYHVLKKGRSLKEAIRILKKRRK